jgi:hypothetical protein
MRPSTTATHDVVAARAVLRPTRGPELSDDEAVELERVLKALADRHRVKILNKLLGTGGEAVRV